MYFWNVNELSTRLKENTLSSFEEAQYYFATFFCFVVCMVLKVYSTRADISLPFTIFTFIASDLAIVCGISYCYYINKSGDGKDFIKRILCLTLPITIRTFPKAFQTFVYTILFSIALIWPITFIVQLFPCMPDSMRLLQGNPFFGTIMCILFILIWIITYYRCLAKELRDIAH